MVEGRTERGEQPNPHSLCSGGGDISASSAITFDPLIPHIKSRWCLLPAFSAPKISDEESPIGPPYALVTGLVVLKSCVVYSCVALQNSSGCSLFSQAIE